MDERRLLFDLTYKSLRRVADSYKDRGCSIHVGKETINVSKELTIFISKAAYDCFSVSSREFSIDLDGKSTEFGTNVFNCLRKLVSMSEGAEYVNFCKSEDIPLRFLGKVLRNITLIRIANELVHSEKEIQIKWNSRMLLEFEDRQAFLFRVCGEKFECPTVLAKLLSAKVSNSILADATVDGLDVTPPDGCDPNEFLNAFWMLFLILSGETLTISTRDAFLFESIALELGSEELLEAIHSFDFGLRPISISNIYFHLRSLPISADIHQYSEVIEFAASNFTALNFDRLRSVPVSSIEKVMKSGALRLRCENQLFDFIGSLIESKVPNAVPLLSNVRFEYLDPQTIQRLKPEMINDRVLDSIRNSIHHATTIEARPTDRWTEQPLLQSIKAVETLEKQKDANQKRFEESEKKNTELQKKIDDSERIYSIFGFENHLKEFPMKKEDDGVFAFFYRLRGNKNPHSEGIVIASSYSNYDDSFKAENPLIWNSDSKWGAKYSNDGWYQIDFKGSSFSLSEFTILTYPISLPRRFSVSASDDGISFIEIKEFTFSDTNESEKKALHFSVDCKEPHRAFKFIQKEYCAKGHPEGTYFCFQFYGIEFFGALRITKN